MAAAPHRCPAAPVLVEPSTPAQHPVAAVHLGVVDVPAPLPHVAEHVVQTPGVGPLPANLVDPATGIAAVPRDLVQHPVSRTPGTGAAGVLPLGLRRQAVPVRRRVPADGLRTGVLEAVRRGQALVQRQCVAEPRRVPPGDGLHGRPGALHRTRPLPGDIRIPFLRDRVLPQPVGREFNRPSSARPPVGERHPSGRDRDHLAGYVHGEYSSVGLRTLASSHRAAEPVRG